MIATIAIGAFNSSEDETRRSGRQRTDEGDKTEMSPHVASDVDDSLQLERDGTPASFSEDAGVRAAKINSLNVLKWLNVTVISCKFFSWPIQL